MKNKLLTLIISVMCLLVSCADVDINQEVSKPENTQAPTVTEAAATSMPEPTSTQVPSPTATPAPTATPEPTATPTPSPTPMPVIGDTFTEDKAPGVFDTNIVIANIDEFYSAKYALIGNYFVTIYNETILNDEEDGGNEIADEADEPENRDEYNGSETFICDIIDLTTGTHNKNYIDMDVDAYTVPEIYPIDDKSFCINANITESFYVYDTDFSLQREIRIPEYYGKEMDDDLYSVYFLFDPDSMNIYYTVYDDSKLYRYAPNADEAETSSSELLADSELLVETYGYKMFTDSVIKAENYNYYADETTSVFIDLNSGEVSSIISEYQNYQLSPDNKELLVSYQGEAKVELYDVEKYEPIRNIVAPDTDATEGPDDKKEINLSISDECWNMTVDWDNRILLTYNTDNSSNSSICHLHAYSLDTGEEIAKVSERFDSGYFTPYIFTVFNSGYQLFTTNEDEYKLLAWDYLNGGINENNDLYVRTNFISEKLDKKRKELEDKYNIYVYLGAEIGEVISDYKMKVCYNQSVMLTALDTIDHALSIYPEDFFEQLKTDGIKTLGIYLCYGFEKNSEYSISDAIAVASAYGYERLLALDLNYSGDYLEENLVHEISHWIDKKIEANDDLDEDGNSIYEKGFSELNPKDFHYCYSYVSGRKYPKYVYNNYSNPEGYFSDEYSQTYPTEDRARMFEYLIYPGYQDYMSSPYIRLKLHYYFDYIREVFDTTNWPEMTVWEEKLLEADRLYGPEEVVEDEIADEDVGEEAPDEAVGEEASGEM